MHRAREISALQLRGHPIYPVVPLVMSLLIWSPAAASAAAPTCVVKLSFSSDDKSDSGTNAYVKEVLTAQGYRIIDDWLLTFWSRSDYDVTIVINHTVVPNYGFPVDLMGMQLSIADSSGKVLASGAIDRANLGDTLISWIPACNASPSTPSPDMDADAK